MKITNKLAGLFLSIFLFTGHLLADTIRNTHVIRAAIDIGMGGPKLQIAEVDLETKIVKMLHTQRYFVNFYDGSKNNNLSSEIMTQGLEAFKKAICVAHSFKVDGITAIATASFRLASNGIEFANTIEEETGVKVHIVDQSLEGKLAFQAVLSKVDVDAANLVVWDIGGGSIQFTGLATDGSFLVDCGTEGSGAFNDYIIGCIQGHDLTERKTPNPMSISEIFQAEIYAENLSQRINQVFKEKISHPDTKVIGVGSVFGYGITTMVAGKNPFCLEDIATIVYGLTGKTDADLGGGEFAFCEGSNTILTFGFMKGLGINQVHIINVNNADGALLYEPFWKERLQRAEVIYKDWKRGKTHH